MSAPKSAARAQTLPLQGLVNHVVRGLLRTPLICRLAGERLVGTQFSWVRNLRTGEPVQIRLLGELRSADVQVLADETDVVEHLAMMARDNHQFAKFNEIRLDERGEPRPDDLHLVWAAGARVVQLTPR
jgi:hypothetical protein